MRLLVADRLNLNIAEYEESLIAAERYEALEALTSVRAAAGAAADSLEAYSEYLRWLVKEIGPVKAAELVGLPRATMTRWCDPAAGMPAQIAGDLRRCLQEP